MKDVMDKAVAAQVERVQAQVLLRLDLKRIPEGVVLDWDRAARKVMLYGDRALPAVVEAVRAQLG
jgi:hypothetical protein